MTNRPKSTVLDLARSLTEHNETLSQLHQGLSMAQFWDGQ